MAAQSTDSVRPYRQSWTPDQEEHDACALIGNVRKTGVASHGNLNRTLEALAKMGHRTGDVEGEGDGCGVLTDIPRKLWTGILEETNRPGVLSLDRRFFVGHFQIPKEERGQAEQLRQQVMDSLRENGLEVLATRVGAVRSQMLGKRASKQEPEFWQVAGLVGNCSLGQIDAKLFKLQLAIERETPIHIASFSSHSVVYKVRGTVETLYQYYPDLRSPDYLTAITVGHSRYSTNTTTVFERVQPFSLSGHNGEFNTIARLRTEAQMLGIQLPVGGSDSQDLNRTLETLISDYGFTLLEAMDLVFPPIGSEIEQLSPELQSLYTFYRHAFGPYAQGPAAMVTRYADECVVSVDALGLRPLWSGETEKEFFFSSEQGAVPLEVMVGDPKPLAPGEKMALRVMRGQGVELLEYPAMQQRLLHLSRLRYGGGEEDQVQHEAVREAYSQPGQDVRMSSWALAGASASAAVVTQPILDMAANAPLAWPSPEDLMGVRATSSENGNSIDDKAIAWGPESLPQETDRWLAAFGWYRDDVKMLDQLAETANEVIGSLGYDGPLAALSRERRNLADYFKESVAVVTNPSIDREREMEHFSLQTVIGPRPHLTTGPQASRASRTVGTPILFGGQPGEPLLSKDEERAIAASVNGMRIEDALDCFDPDQLLRCQLSTVSQREEGIPEALKRIAHEAIEAVRRGTQVLLIDDSDMALEDHLWLDPHLVVAVIDHSLRTTFANTGGGQRSHSLRRDVGIILRSGSLRNLHDLILALGLGADAVNPYILLRLAAVGERGNADPKSYASRIANVVSALDKGLEKVISTVGCHELRGYGRLFASIGLAAEVAERFEMVNYCGSARTGLGWTDLIRDAEERAEILQGMRSAQLSRTYHFFPKIWKLAGKIATKQATYAEYNEQIQALEKENPISLRHLMGFRQAAENHRISANDVDIGLAGNDLPFVISSMSFGSQGETAFRAYAEAAYRMNMICLNGEGGEIPDLLGRYPHNRGQQIASGRFGVNIDLLNSSNLLEIKIGQGAKPGEGGHLPGRKVSPKVANARHARPGVDLISPSNNHDLYSIEDLAQVIEELKTANPRTRVSVKVPVVPGIGVIVVGIAKAGADIINLSGFDGGTGAARKHALQHVGLPAEIGIKLAHRALLQSGIRHKVELWCDGGMKSAMDVVKMLCLGANRVGFGTMAMVAIGCTICRACQTDTCHVGIATQIESQEEAAERGLKRFVPQNYDRAVENLCNLFSTLATEVKSIVGQLGFRRAQDLVGLSNLLEQVNGLNHVDLSELLEPVMVSSARSVGAVDRALRRPRNHLTTLISELIMDAVEQGERTIVFEDDRVNAADRALGTHLAGEIVRYQRRISNNGNRNKHDFPGATLRFYASSIGGNGLGAFNTDGVQILVEGGAQDGMSKCSRGGKAVVLKGMNHLGELVDGSVGKSFAYGAQGGLFIIQGNADSRACIRLSGARVLIGGDIQQPLNDQLGLIGARANVKGFLCEYMTDGIVVVLGDPGPWICAGMTGGTLYLRLRPDMGLNRDAVNRRIARGGQVSLKEVTAEDEEPVTSLLRAYYDELAASNQSGEAKRIERLIQDWARRFVKIEPSSGLQVDQTISTE